MYPLATPATMSKNSMSPSGERTFPFFYYIALLWLWRFLCGDWRSEVFALYSLCVWCQMASFFGTKTFQYSRHCPNLWYRGSISLIYTALQYRKVCRQMSVFFILKGNSASTAGFLFLIFLSTTSMSSCLNCPSLISSRLIMIFVTGWSVSLRGSPREQDLALNNLQKLMRKKIIKPSNSSIEFQIKLDSMMLST